MKVMSNKEIESLVALMSKIPGLGPRSARRAVLYLIERKKDKLEPLINALTTAKDKIITCDECGNLDSGSPCHICSDKRRSINQICVVENITDLWALERACIFNGRYHVLGGTLAALDGVGPDNLKIDKLIKRITKDKVTEVILAMSSTVDGQTTAHYLTKSLKKYKLDVSQLAQGIPVGGSLDFLDEGTIALALRSRQMIT